jgi:multiple sugar transport system ATP-binding protein
VQQVDSPLNLYNNPANMFVAGFIGSPAMNFIPVDITGSNGKLYADSGNFKVEIPADKTEKAATLKDKKAVFGIRPEDIYDRNLEGLVKPTDGNTVQVGVDVMEPLGDDVEMHVTSGEHALVAKLDSKTRAKVGESLDVIFDMERSHLFDPESESAVY